MISKDDPFARSAPDLSEFDATPDEKMIAEKYTQIQPCICGDLEDAHTVWLCVGSQGFRVSPDVFDSAEHASWMCWMLAKALIAVIEGER